MLAPLGRSNFNGTVVKMRWCGDYDKHGKSEEEELGQMIIWKNRKYRKILFG